MQKSKKPHKKQKGAALILMAFIIGLAVIAYLLHALDPQRLRLEQDKKTMQTLNEAKQALIAWSVSHKYNPGQMPWPDRNGDGVYDGSSDCVTTLFQYSFLLGQLPSKPDTSPCLDPNNGLTVYTGLSTYPSLGKEFRDAQGNRLWYAVSRNLVYDSEHNESPIINPGMINPPYAITPYLRQGGTQAYPWLQVLDRNGNLVSDKVAVVIIAAGDPLVGQNRAAVAPNASEFLDSFKIGAANYKNSDSAIADEDFIMGEDSRNVPSSDPTFVQPYNFNDKLVYITVDELMYVLEKRVLEEAKNTLKAYYVTNGYYPFAAGLNSATNPNQCVQGNYRGLLPVNAPLSHTCSCTSSTKTCSCNFSVVSSISFTRSSGTFAAFGANGPTGACTVSPTNTCTCNGVGSCKRSSGAVQFSCDACGTCTAAVAGTNKFNTMGTFTSAAGICTNTSNQATCSTSANGTFTLSACADSPIPTSPTINGLAPWFLANHWENYIYYATSSNCTSTGVNCTTATPQLTVGTKSNIRAVLASPGAAIVAAPYAASKSLAQSARPSCEIKDYLDATENTNQAIANGLQDFLYQITQNRGESYNDQIVIVAP